MVVGDCFAQSLQGPALETWLPLPTSTHPISPAGEMYLLRKGRFSKGKPGGMPVLAASLLSRDQIV